MPQTGSPLDTIDLTNIRNWISQGALNNWRRASFSPSLRSRMGDPEGRVAPHEDAVAVGWVFRPIRRLFLPSSAAPLDAAGRGQRPPPRPLAHRSVPMARGPGEL